MTLKLCKIIFRALVHGPLFIKPDVLIAAAAVIFSGCSVYRAASPVTDVTVQTITLIQTSVVRKVSDWLTA